MSNTTIEEALGKLKKYREIVDTYLPNDKVVYTSLSPTVYPTMICACIESIAILEGDEEKFKTCLEATRKKNPSMGWGFYFDETNYQQAAQDMKTLAYLLRKE